MARINYFGWDLPDGAEVPDVPADLKDVVDGARAQLPPRCWRATAAHPANTDAGVTTNLLSRIVNDARGGLVVIMAEIWASMWNANSSGSITAWVELRDSTNAIVSSQQGQALQASFGMAAAPAANLPNATLAFHYPCIMPASAGDCSVLMRGAMNTQAGWSTAAKCDWFRANLTILLFAHNAPITGP